MPLSEGLNFVATDSDVFTGEMSKITFAMTEGAEDRSGEALTEVLLAMAIGQLRLIKADETRVASRAIDRQATMPGIVILLAEAMEAGVFSGVPRIH